MSKFKAFLKRKNIEISFKRYFIDAMGAMALGLFSSLLIGTIFGTIGQYIPGSVGEFLAECASFAKNGYVCGAVIGVAIANSLGSAPLVMFSSGVVGAAGYSLGSAFMIGGAEKMLTAGPAGAFVAVLIAAELGKVVSKETKVDIIVTPTVTIVSGLLVAKLVCSPIAWAMYYLGDFINTATVLQPFVMGIIISVVVGIILTLPISSAAICAMIGISGIAGGAAAAGCCAQMVGFAVISFRENKWGGIVAQGLGTSMLQMGNIIKKPIIWLPVTLASAVTGPISTMVFKLECVGVSAGMGTCGLVGPIGIIDATANKDAMFWVGLALVCVVLPAILSVVFNEILRKVGLIKTGDMKLDL
ncbi:MAG: PTS sugar transporter subunit IIC [Ruminococcaceae bacterium]|nr:PTS sugar transporter subunit IIC [Oscillospiraceae bacterium]